MFDTKGIFADSGGLRSAESEKQRSDTGFDVQMSGNCVLSYDVITHAFQVKSCRHNRHFR